MHFWGKILIVISALVGQAVAQDYMLCSMVLNGNESKYKELRESKIKFVLEFESEQEREIKFNFNQIVFLSVGNKYYKEKIIVFEKDEKETVLKEVETDGIKYHKIPIKDHLSLQIKTKGSNFRADFINADGKGTYKILNGLGTVDVFDIPVLVAPIYSVFTDKKGKYVSESRNVVLSCQKAPKEGIYRSELNEKELMIFKSDGSVSKGPGALQE